MNTLSWRLLAFAPIVMLLGCNARLSPPGTATETSSTSTVENASPGGESSVSGQPTGTLPTLRSRFWAKKTTPAGEELEVISDRAILESGTEIGWKIQLDQTLNVYVIYRGPGDAVSILFPEEGATSVTKQGIHTIVPSGSQMDEETGIERFYLIASKLPVEPLESLIADFQTAPEDGRASITTSLLEALLSVRKQHESVASIAGRPARIGGASRGNDDQEDAIEYDVDGVVCRTFTIDHR